MLGNLVGNAVRCATHGGVLVGVCLGLSIVKRRLALLEAAQQLRSEPGRGTCFSIALPLAKPMPARPDPDR